MTRMADITNNARTATTIQSSRDGTSRFISERGTRTTEDEPKQIVANGVSVRLSKMPKPALTSTAAAANCMIRDVFTVKEMRSLRNIWRGVSAYRGCHNQAVGSDCETLRRPWHDPLKLSSLDRPLEPSSQRDWNWYSEWQFAFCISAASDKRDGIPDHRGSCLVGVTAGQNWRENARRPSAQANPAH